MSRLIDADLLGLTDMEIIMCDGDYKEALKMLIDKIEHAPTIEERKTGKWIGYNTEQDGWKRTDGSPVFMSCSECNGLVLNNGSAHWNFCPNCGAKMEVDNDDIPIEYFESGGK